ncbi:Beta-lactamase domain protein [Desulfamplus magnetovallimortis]|uniref:Beta-lactamase domain protein n=2 Tax=Desulfamplus magnetovallimortis TaxID=1246637 RepID=A0A1W1H8U4_9BACT|nr:Beta-lactamase domain protein [Desulfamplus magnetovallimortis]
MQTSSLPSLSICPLASGSRGNAIYVSGGKSAVLVDAGLSGVEIERRMALRGISPQSIDAVVVSHEHTDHVKGAGIFSRRYKIPLYINEKTFNTASPRLGSVNFLNYFKCGRPFNIGELTINPFSISHDAADPSGFTFERLKAKLSITTDLGIVTNLVKSHLKGSSLVYLEANHDPEMLQYGPYPWHLKQRIKSRRGHLSNQEAGELLCEIQEGVVNGDKCLSHVILAHLSEENNTPEKALETVNRFLGASHKMPPVKVDVAMPDTPGEMVHLN